MTSPIKYKIRNKFNRAASTYDRYCSTQQDICQRSIQLLLDCQKAFDNIADFGCGTGESTQGLIQNLDLNYCYAVDFAEQLLATAQSKLAHIRRIDWIHSDFDQPMQIDKPLELIFCNMSLQWSSDISTAIHLWRQYLKNNGLLLFSIPIAGNFPELKTSCKLDLLSHQTIMNNLTGSDWRLIAYETRSFEKEFSHPLEILKTLKATGTNYNKTLHQQKPGLSPIKIDQFFINPDSNKLTYRIGIYLVRKIL